MRNKKHLINAQKTIETLLESLDLDKQDKAVLCTRIAAIQVADVGSSIKFKLNGYTISLNITSEEEKT